MIPLVAVIAGSLLERWLPLGRWLGLEPEDAAQGWALWQTVLHRVGEGQVVFAAILVLWAVVMLMRSGQDPRPETPTPKILESGPFRLSRNPIYLAMVVFCLGFGLMEAKAWILLLTPLVPWALQRWAILPEEAYLEEKFGEPYRDYRQRVRRWL